MRKCFNCGYVVEVGYVAQGEVYCEWCIVNKIVEMEEQLKNLSSKDSDDGEELPLDEMVM